MNPEAFFRAGCRAAFLLGMTVVCCPAQTLKPLAVAPAGVGRVTVSAPPGSAPVPVVVRQAPPVRVMVAPGASASSGAMVSPPLPRVIAPPPQAVVAGFGNGGIYGVPGARNLPTPRVAAGDAARPAAGAFFMGPTIESTANVYGGYAMRAGPAPGSRMTATPAAPNAGLASATPRPASAVAVARPAVAVSGGNGFPAATNSANAPVAGAPVFFSNGQSYVNFVNDSQGDNSYGTFAFGQNRGGAFFAPSLAGSPIGGGNPSGFARGSGGILVADFYSAYPYADYDGGWPEASVSALVPGAIQPGVMSNYFGSGLEPVKYGYAPLGYTDSAYAAAPAVTLYNPTIDTPSYYILPYALSANAGPVGHDGGADDAVPSAPLNLADYPLLPYGPPPLF